MEKRYSVAIVGSGPAALMAASRLASAACQVTVFEKRKSPGRKLLVAGSSGLNISNSLPLEEFVSYYSAHPHDRDFWRRVIGFFPPQAWIAFIEKLGISTFEGTSGRTFIEDKKAARFLQLWTQSLTSAGVVFKMGMECVGYTP